MSSAVMDTAADASDDDFRTSPVAISTQSLDCDPLLDVDPDMLPAD